MAKIVAGFASSHTPLMSLPGQDWAKRAEDDKRNRELIRPRDGAHVTYDELLATADPNGKYTRPRLRADIEPAQGSLELRELTRPPELQLETLRRGRRLTASRPGLYGSWNHA